MVFYLSCTLTLALSCLSLLVVVDVASAWGGPRLEALAVAAPTRRRRAAAFCVRAAAASSDDSDDQHEEEEEEHDEDEAVLLLSPLQSSRNRPSPYPPLLLPLDSVYLYSSILWEPHNDAEFSDFFEFQQQHFENDSDNDVDQECSIPDEYKQLATSTVQANVWSFLGIHRAKAIRSTTTTATPPPTTSISTAVVLSAVSSGDKQNDNNDDDDDAGIDDWCHVDDANCNNNNECSFPNDYKQLSTPAIQANVMSFLGIKRANAVTTTTTTTTTVSSSSSSSTSSLSSSADGNHHVDDGDDASLSSPSTAAPSRISEWE